MGGTAIGREARRRETWRDGRAGPNREHVRREPLSVRTVPWSVCARNCKRRRGIPRRRSTFASLSSLFDLSANLPQRLLLQLPDSLAGQVVLVADFFQRELVLVVEAEAPA